ncbi:MAG TPA: aminoglycoside phosphotransferase family protein, partial [Alphaproteobacteria bacterium]|nr:aminoglycoside phosphotransferase family protein [Alphaproteobacteria bacterium]
MADPTFPNPAGPNSPGSNPGGSNPAGPKLVASSSHSYTALYAALKSMPGFERLERKDLEPAGYGGTTHDHVRIRGTGFVLRLPRTSQWDLAAEINLAYQATGFRRAAQSGHTPRLVALLPPDAELPMGGLIVEEIAGRKPRLPDDLGAIAECLRAVHGLQMPPPGRRPPLLAPSHPLDHLISTVNAQAPFLERAGLSDATLRPIRAELDWARDYAGAHRTDASPQSLILTDTHPGNFVVDGAGKAWFVDLEKTMYSLPAIDLAHATLYTSTRFDPEADKALDADDTAGFYRAYLSKLERRAAFALMPWLAPVRRFVYLRTLTWCAKWQVESQSGNGRSRDHLDAATRAHMDAILKDFFEPATIER